MNPCSRFGLPLHDEDWKKVKWRYLLRLFAYSPPKRLEASEPKLVTPCLKQEIEKLFYRRNHSLQRPRMCILGGGFGGLYIALRLESLVLVDQSKRFVFKPMLYELLSGEVEEWEIAPRFADFLARTDVQFFQDRVKLLRPMDHLGINAPPGSGSGGTVQLESDLLVEYDWYHFLFEYRWFLLLGAEAKLDVVPGAAEYALPFSTLEDALKVDNKLKALERRNFGKGNFGKGSKIRVAVVGCGYSGVELAATLSKRLQEKGIVKAINVDTTICPTAPSGNRQVAMKVLSSRKVELLLGYFVRNIRKSSDAEDSFCFNGNSKGPVGHAVGMSWLAKFAIDSIAKRELSWRFFFSFGARLERGNFVP
ncbi:hypothetical protein ACJRO7_010175 [Eucalyptus globulus]|uniref:FAD/NAD(P)-binding domain-containing protein n=1 Tax=Eucalyptus globulus TaxID=34317 RepID=A0ABD3LEQ6_EUCGL